MAQTDFAPWPSFTEEEVQAVAEVMRSNKVNYWTGTITRDFEKDFATYAGCAHAVAVTNGTVALDLALAGLGIGSANGGAASDEVIVTPRSFMASVSTIVNAGARPVFVDVGRDSQNIEAPQVSAALTPNTRAVLCVHLAGWPCDVDAIRASFDGRDIAIVEDCAQAHGTLYKGRPVGGLGDVAAWSFCQDKIMTTGGEGGMVTCNDEALWRRMWAYKDHGKSYEAVYERDHAPGFRWLHESFGTNWRMLEMQAAIGRIQLRRMPEWTAARNANADRLTEGFAQFAGPEGLLRLPRVAAEHRHAYYKYYAFVRPEGLAPGWSRDRIVSEISGQGVPCMQGSCSEMYLEKAFDGTGLRPEPRLPVARELGETSLMFLVHPTLTEAQMDRAVSVAQAVFAEASA